MWGYKKILQRIGVVAIACALSFGAGWYAHRPTTDSKTSDTVTSDTTTVTKWITKPDGTKEKIIVKKEKSTKKSVTKKKEAAPVVANQPKYSVGAYAHFDGESLKPSYDFSVGYRVLGNAWVDAIYMSGHRAVAVGVRIEF